MTTQPAGNDVEDQDHEHSALDWFKVLDVAVWVAVAVIGAIALEWFVGFVVRERIARGANRYLAAKADAGTTT